MAGTVEAPKSNVQRHLWGMGRASPHLAQEIARDRALAHRLVLESGTALNLFHLGLDRFSGDIDLKYVGALDRAAMEAERPDVDAASDRLLTSQGYGARRRPSQHAGGT